MRIALIRRRFSAVGGAELYLDRLLRALSAAGHEVHLLAEAWDAPDLPARLHPIQVKAPRALRLPAFAAAVERELLGMNLDVVFSLERTLKQDVYRAGDGVHASWLAHRRAHAPWWKRPFLNRSRFHREMLDLERQTLDPARTGRVIVNSRMVKAEILEHFDFPEDRIHHVPNGIDVPRWRSGNPEAVRCDLGLSPRVPLVLFVGSGWERKGLRYAVEAVHRWRSQGEGPAREARLLVAGRGRWPGPVPPWLHLLGQSAHLEDLYAAADVFLFPAVYEPSSNVVPEAMAAGLPVITTRSNGASEWVKEFHYGSIVSDPADISGLVAALQQWCGVQMPEVPEDRLSLQSNLQATLQVLDQAREGRAS